MIFGCDFYVEEKFTYKGFNCYIGLLDLGFRDGYVEFNTKDFNKTHEELFDLIESNLGFEITYSKSSEIDDYWIFGFDYGHIHNYHDIEAFKKYFPDIANKEAVHMKRCDENMPFGVLGTFDVAKNDCLSLANELAKYKIGE